MERQRLVAHVAGVGVRAVLQQEPHGVRVAHRQMEPGRASLVACASQTGIAPEQVAQRHDVSRGAGREERLQGRGIGEIGARHGPTPVGHFPRSIGRI